MFIPIFIGAASFSVIYSLVYIEGLIVFSLLYFSGFIINSLADREMDKKYRTFKGSIADSVELIGIRNVKIILSGQVLLAVLLTLHLSIVLTNFWIILLVGLGIIFGLGYSVEPFYFKVKGAWHAVALASSAFFLPLMFLYLVVAKPVEILDIILILGITIAHYSMEMANQAADHMEDEEAGIQTPTVRMGLDSALKASIIMTTVGMFIIILTIAAMYITTGFSESLGLGSLQSSLPISVLILLTVGLIIAAGYYIPLRGLKALYGYSIDFAPIEERIHLIKKRVSYAAWQAFGISGVVVTVGILFFVNLQAPIAPVTDNTLNSAEAETELDINDLRIGNVKVTLGNEGENNNYADVTVRGQIKNIEDRLELTEVKAFVSAGTANEIFKTSSENLDEDGRAVVTVDLLGNNESEVWYFIDLHYKGERSSYTWTEPSASKLYIFDAELKKVEDGILYNHFELSVKTYNSGPGREAGSISIKVEWAPLQVNWSSNEKPVNPHQVWKSTLSREILKEWLTDSSTIKIYLYYDDEQFDIMELQV